jgi:hypothetical protein
MTAAALFEELASNENIPLVKILYVATTLGLPGVSIKLSQAHYV